MPLFSQPQHKRPTSKTNGKWQKHRTKMISLCPVLHKVKYFGEKELQNCFWYAMLRSETLTMRWWCKKYWTVSWLTESHG
ncbi:hypothetical protein CMV_025295 [Castanea mollissima]|uniref:Uncharacterized protein n=1 Tax=Castanea mollissima TaxID=60419 RepID=A0A8J4QPY3_9ROSI|nr:hypothetical protein CMV_025295 [Castanea mollissima]